MYVTRANMGMKFAVLVVKPNFELKTEVLTLYGVGVLSLGPITQKKSICQVHPSVVKSWCQNGPFSKIYTYNSSQRSNCRCKFIFRSWIVKQFSISKVELLHQQQRKRFAWVVFLVLRYNLVPSHRWSFFQSTQLALQICTAIASL